MPLLWRPVDLAHSTATDSARGQDQALPGGAGGLDGARTLGNGNQAVGETGLSTAGAGIVNGIVNRTRQAREVK